MQYSTALSLYLLAMAGPASILGQVVTVWDQATTIITVTAGDGAPTPPANNAPPVEEKVADNPPPSPASSSSAPPPPPSSAASSAAAASTGSSSGSGGKQSSDGSICFNFSGNENFHFLNTGTWPSNKGSGTEAASQCFPLTPNAGMFICESECAPAGDAALAAYTKLECTLNGDYPNCDISLVDGFSLPLKCTIPGAGPLDFIGGETDLDTLASCPNTGDDNTCKNANAYQGSASDVTTYFQNANYDPQKQTSDNYCTYQQCGPYSDIFLKGTPTVECIVGTRGGSSSTSKRDNSKNALSQREGLTARSHTHRHSHAHARIRGLKDLEV